MPANAKAVCVFAQGGHMNNAADRKKMDGRNGLNHPEVARHAAFKDSKIKKRKTRQKVPAMSVVVINVR